MELLCIGFDGLDHREWSRRLADQLPGFEYVLLHSPVPVSGPAWTSIYTGLPMEQHGVTDLWGRPEAGSKTHADVSPLCVWNALYRHGKQVALCNLPCTYPPSSVHPFHVSGFPWPDDKCYWHPERLGVPRDFKWRCEMVHWAEKHTPDGWAPQLRKWNPLDVRGYVEFDMRSVIKWFAGWKTKAADLGWLVFTFPDRLLHLWPDASWIHRFNAQMVMEAITQLEAMLQPKATLVMSDHGWLERGQLGQFNHTEEGVLAWRGMDMPQFWGAQMPTVSHVAHILADYFGVPLRSYAENLSEADMSYVRERLKSLGYFD